MGLIFFRGAVIIGTAYRAPWQDVVAHLDALTDTITSFPNCDNLILAGDLNIDLLDSKNTKIPVLQQFLHCLNLKQIIAQPTHFHDDQTQTLIDIVCTNTSFKTVATKHTPELGRHAMLVVEFRIKKETPKPQLVTYRPLRGICTELFSEDLTSIDWNPARAPVNVDEQVEAMTAKVLSLFDRHAPLKTVKFKGPPHPWITGTVRRMIRIRDSYHAKYKEDRSKTNLLQGHETCGD
ncbi:unnamed protein product [Euphydryas editha]|uniref:Endonuclease/exonuclease/phosphatase domain-containing protein n=1 Tax=Euphydryas editha TaxID=104508 RepID=A0AAU9UIV6_EUPED|nr:unnamed protein product [Euphydryas editha]